MLDQIYSIIERGGPIMWPLLITSIVSIGVSLERILFILRYRSSINQNHQQKFAELLAAKKLKEAFNLTDVTTDPLLKTLATLNLSSISTFQIGFLRNSSILISTLKRGSGILDTAITIAPLLGLLGTVTGLIQSFYSLGNAELSSPLAITGGISEALIATGFGLGIAIFCLIPFNLLTSAEESSRETLEQLSSMVEVALDDQTKSSTLNN